MRDDPGKSLTGDHIDCSEIVARLGAYLDGVLVDDERTLFEAHLRTCSGCHRFRLQLSLVRDALAKTADALTGEPDDVPTHPWVGALFAEWTKARDPAT